MKDKIITVFGGTGFIGKYVIADLAKAGYTIRLVTRSLERAKDLRTGAFVGQVVPVVADLTKQADYNEIVRNSYAVVNLVGILFESGKQKFQTLQTEFADKVSKAAKAEGVQKFVHISAIVDPESKSKYAQSKITGEKAVATNFPEAIILKPSVVFGPEDNFFNKFASMATFSPFLPLIGGGNTKFQPVYVGDVAKAVLNVIESPTIKAGAYQLGGPEVSSFKDILQGILRYTNRKRCLLNIPFCVAKLIAIPAPSSILTADQVTLLQSDNVVTSKGRTLAELGVEATSVDSVIPRYLARYRKKAV
jgi:NADH dehydrogenase